jgi:hypothetical protein
MTGDLNEFANFVFKAGQQPASWLRSAAHLRDAAEAIINHELPAGSLYVQARQIADEEASAESVRSGTGVGTEIQLVDKGAITGECRLYASEAGVSSYSDRGLVDPQSLLGQTH